MRNAHRRLRGVKPLTRFMKRQLTVQSEKTARLSSCFCFFRALFDSV